MNYLFVFGEGILTFLSPCLLPMLPVYLLYFAGGKVGTKGEQRDVRPNTPSLLAALGFVLGFTLVFTAMGAFAGFIGGALRRHSTVVNLVTGAIVFVFGLYYMGVVRIGFLDRNRRPDVEIKPLGFCPAVLFGMVFAVGWTPCVGAFLGTALLLASQQGSWAEGVLMLLLFSLGLGIPFIASALLIDKLKGAFAFIQKNYEIINRIAGILLCVVGILMATGQMNRLLGLFQ